MAFFLFKKEGEYRANQAGSNPKFSFNWRGKSNKVYLFEAFKEFIAPAKRAIKVAIEEKKQQSAERNKIRREGMPEKKIKHSQAR